MKRLLLAASAITMALGLGSCISTGGLYDSGYDTQVYTTQVHRPVYGQYGYDTNIIIINNGYSYGYSSSVVDEITRRMVRLMALDRLHAQRLLALNRRYFYLFHSMPHYSCGYYGFSHFGPHGNRPAGPSGPGYYGGGNRPPYGGNGSYRGTPGGSYRVNMNDKQIQNAAKEYNREMRNIVGNKPYSVFEKSVRDNARKENRTVNAVRSRQDVQSAPSNNTTTGVRNNGTRNNSTTPTGVRSNGTRNNSSTGNAVRSNSSSSPKKNNNATGVRSNSGTRNNSQSGASVRSNSSKAKTTTEATRSNRTRGK